MPIRDIGARKGRVYRKIAYGPLLDVFMIDMRSYRDESWNKGDDHRGWILGAEQLAWLKRELAASRATWKVIAADLPIGLVSLDAVALGMGRPTGASTRSPIFSRRSSAPASATSSGSPPTCTTPPRIITIRTGRNSRISSRSGSSSPGPLHAGTWGPGELDNTFGPGRDVPELVQ